MKALTRLPQKVITGLKFSKDITLSEIMCAEMTELNLSILKSQEQARCTHSDCEEKPPPTEMENCYSPIFGDYGFC